MPIAIEAEAVCAYRFRASKVVIVGRYNLTSGER
jgi:hypothetical protein